MKYVILTKGNSHFQHHFRLGKQQQRKFLFLFTSCLPHYHLFQSLNILLMLKITTDFTHKFLHVHHQWLRQFKIFLYHQLLKHKLKSCYSLIHTRIYHRARVYIYIYIICTHTHTHIYIDILSIMIVCLLMTTALLLV